MYDFNIIHDNSLYNLEYFLQDGICRFCWNTKGEVALTSNSDEDNLKSKNNLLDKVQECLDISVAAGSIPTMVCLSCCNNIENFHRFKDFCTKTESKLNEILKNYNHKSSSSANQKSEVKIEKSYFDANDDLPKTEFIEDFLECLYTSDQHNSEDDIPLKELKITKTRAIVKKKKRTATYCNICLLEFKTKELFFAHNSKSHGIEVDGLFKCFGCEKRFKTRRGRLSHEHNFCQKLSNGYKCSKCDFHLPTRRMYESHMRNHRQNVIVNLPDDIFKCKKCDEKFKTRPRLQKHMEEHDMEKKNFVCECCGRVFTRQDYLHKHKLTHSGLKQHVCPHCGFRTTQRSSLTVHIRKHTGERPYSCDLCPQKCVSSSNLKAHRRRHIGLKKFECTLCSKKFGYKASLDEHFASTHDRSQSYICAICGATYTRSRGLRRHLLAKHEKHDSSRETAAITEKSQEIQFVQENELYLKIVPNTEKDKSELTNVMVKSLNLSDFSV